MLPPMLFVPSHSIIGPASASATIFVLHGILGSGKNWRSFARRLASRTPSRRYVLVDLRHHGDSAAIGGGAAIGNDAAVVGPDTLSACAADLARLALVLKTPPTAVIGHSFGGKVALTYLAELGVGVEAVWVLDSPPGAGDSGTGRKVDELIAALADVPEPIASREWLAEHLLGAGISSAIAHWMTTNITRRDGGFRWRFRFEGIRPLLADYWRRDLWSVVESPPAGAQVHVVRAGCGDGWSAADVARLDEAGRGPRTHVHDLPRAGHWLHVDDPDGLLEIIAPTPSPH